MIKLLLSFCPSVLKSCFFLTLQGEERIKMSDVLHPFLALKYAQDGGRNGFNDPNYLTGYVGGRHGPREVRGAAGTLAAGRGGARDQNGTK